MRESGKEMQKELEPESGMPSEETVDQTLETATEPHCQEPSLNVPTDQQGLNKQEEELWNQVSAPKTLKVELKDRKVEDEEREPAAPFTEKKNPPVVVVFPNG